MATPLAPPQAAMTTPHRYGMCLLHADYHPTGTDCLAYTLDWYLAHHHLPKQQADAEYQLEVERAILNQHIRTHTGLPD